MPAGHNCPPHPSFASDSSTSGGERRPSKSRDVRKGIVGGSEGIRSSGRVNNVSEGLGGDVMVLLVLFGNIERCGFLGYLGFTSKLVI